MQITLNQAEIEKAIIEYAEKLISITGNINVSLAATRNPAGISATIDIIKEGGEAVTTKAAKAPKAKAAVDKEPVVEEKSEPEQIQEAPPLETAELTPGEDKPEEDKPLFGQS